MPLCDVFKVRKHVRSLHCSTLITPQKILKTQLPPQKRIKVTKKKKHQTNKTAETKKKKKIQKNTKKTKQIKIMIKIPHRYGKKDSLEFRGT